MALAFRGGMVLALAALASFLLAFYAVEFAIEGVSNKASGPGGVILYKPNKTVSFGGPGGEYFATRSVNSLGFMDMERVVEKPAGVKRIAIVGDSFVEAHQVPREKAFPALLESELEGVEVLAFGREALGTLEEEIVIERFVLQFKPDVIVLAFVPNDPADSFYYNRRASSPFSFLSNTRLYRILEGQVAFYFTSRLFNDVTPWLKSYESTGAAYPEVREGWALARGSIQRIKERAAAENASLVVAYVPEPLEFGGLYESMALKAFPFLDGKLDLGKPRAELEKMASELGVCLIDFSDALSKEEQKGQRTYYLEDLHLNELGNEAAARALKVGLASCGSLD